MKDLGRVYQHNVVLKAAEEFILFFFFDLWDGGRKTKIATRNLIMKEFIP